MYTEIWMQSFFRNSGSNTFSRITTFPSATDVSSRSPARCLRFGTMKKAVCQQQTQTMAAITTPRIQCCGMSSTATTAIAAQIR